MLGYALGAQFNSAPKEDLGLRASLMLGSYLYMPWGGNITPEANVGLLINQRLSVGVKYMHPLFLMRPDHDYRVRYVMAEAKIRFGARTGD